MGLVERLDFRPHSKQEAQPKQAKDKKGIKSGLKSIATSSTF